MLSPGKILKAWEITASPDALSPNEAIISLVLIGIVSKLAFLMPLDISKIKLITLIVLLSKGKV